MRGIQKLQRYLKNRKYRLKNKNKDFTIISQNCLGGVIYNQLGIQFASPTINMFIEDENFVKLVNGFEQYLCIKPHAITDKYVDPIDSSICYPKIRIGDIELCCLHYKNCEEAIGAWERRKTRVNLNNCYVIANSWNLHNRDELIKEVCKNRYKKTIVFTMEEKPYENCLKLPGDFWTIDERGIVRPNLTDFVPGSYLKYYEQFFDVVKFLN